MRCIAATLLLLTAMALRAGEILETEVVHTDGRYTVSFDIRMAAPPERLKHYLTNYGKYAEYFNSVADSAVLDHRDERTQRVRLRLHSCVLFFCRTVTQVKEITEQPDGTIVARIDPKESDFDEAVEHWQILVDGGATRLRYRAELVPNFYVPPLIGPWLLKREIRAALAAGAETLESLANE